MTLRSSLARCLMVLSLGALAPLSVACGAKSVTETGNPPFIDEQRLDIQRSDDGIRVVGRKGSTPGGAQVTLSASDGSVSADTTSSGDGSFELELEGDPGADYELAVEQGDSTRTLTLPGESPTLEPEPASPNGGSGGEPGGDPIDAGSGGDRCETVVQRGWEDLQTFADGLGRECQRDEDCVLVEVSLACTPCGQLAPVNQEQAATIDQALAAVRDQTCPGYEDLACPKDDGCPVPNEITTCLVEPVSPMGTPLPGYCEAVPATCETRQGAAHQAVNDALTEAQQGCNVDADCDFILAPTLSCLFDHGACGQRETIATAKRATLEATLASLDQEHCAASAEAGCPNEDGGCPPTAAYATAMCVDATCVPVLDLE